MASTGSRLSSDEIPTVVASKDIEVQDPTSSDPLFKRQIIAGQPVPPDLLEAYNDATGDRTAVKAVRGPAVDKAQRAPDVSK
ncbi:MAG: hypothetical protein WKF96_01330 [Solirubrobacteraceae bacterium]